MARDRYDDDDRPRRRRDEDGEEDRPRSRQRDRDDDDDDDRPRSRRRRDDDDSFDRTPPPAGNGMAVAALILGVMSLFFGPFTGLIGGILGMIALSKPTGRGLAVTGLVLSFFFSAAWIGVGTWAYMASQKSRKETNHLKELGLASHNHHDANGHLPQPEEDGTLGFNPQSKDDPTSKLSWRVSILPYIEQDNVYRQFQLKEVWDSPTNRPHADKVIRQYADLDTPTDPTTRWRCFYGEQTMFPLNGRISLVSITDGTSNTIMYVEGGDKVTWSRFQEYKYDPTTPLPPLGKPSKPGFLVVMGDGSVRTIRKTISENNLRAMITRAGGEVVDFDR